eukprot:TRINITY_DN5049_c0_g1_i2.p1 TRINITY_DN5049_c0_g1~~TRINITY_DN5049_c0_g1_i2.p1  ORF type:complete len:229 (+),score=22.85 TRINITY_DN5049_c0_g1_i2:119-805(+)
MGTMAYNPQNRSYQYILLQNKAFHERALKGTKSPLRSLWNEADDQSKRPGFIPNLPDEAPEFRRKNRRSTSRNNVEKRIYIEETPKAKVRPQSVVGRFDFQQQKVNKKILDDNLRMAQKLFEVKPTVITRREWRSRIKSLDKTKRHISEYDQHLQRKDKLLICQDTYKIKAIEEYSEISKFRPYRLNLSNMSKTINYDRNYSDYHVDSETGKKITPQNLLVNLLTEEI